MSLTRCALATWSGSCKWAIPGTRPLQQQGFRSVDQPHIACGKRGRGREKTHCRMEDMGIQPNCEKLCSNGFKLSAALLHRRQAGKCKQHCKNDSAFVSALGTSIESVPN